MRGLLIVGVLGLVGCASAPASAPHAQFVHDLLLSVERAQLMEIDMARQGHITAADHRQWQMQFKTLAGATQTYVRALQSGAPTSTAAMSVALTSMSTRLVPRIADATARLAVQATLDTIRVLLASRQTTQGPLWIPQPLAC